MMSSESKLSMTGWKILFVVMVIVIPFYLGPLLYVVDIALQSQHQFLVNPMALPSPLKWGNFIDAWHKGSMGQYYINSIVYTVVPTVVSLILAIFVAFPISRKYVAFSNKLYVLLMSGLFLPVGIIPLFIEARMLHLYNNRPGYMILHLQMAMNFAFFFFVGYFRTIPRELDESAVLDGCGYIRYVFTIVTPLAKPALATVGIYSAIQIWNDLIGPTVFLASRSLFPLTRGLFSFYGSYQSQWTLLAAGVLIVAAPLVLTFRYLQRYFVEGATSGAMKM